MPKTNWQDPGSSEVRSTHISGLQEAVGKIEDVLDMQLQAETGIGLSEVYISEQDRYRIFQAPEGKRNWASSPAPVIKKNGAVISSGFTIDYGGGAVIFSAPLSGTDTVTADFSRVKTEGSIIETLGGGKASARFVIGTSTAGWTEKDCDYLCDGTEDDVQINTAITELPPSGGEIVILDGTYNITAKVNVAKDNVSIRGNGNATILKRMWDSSTVEGVITLTEVEGCRVENLQIDGNKATHTSSNNYGIQLSSSSNNAIIGSTCNNASTSIYLNSSSNNTIESNNCNNNTHGIVLTSSSDNNTVTGNSLSNNESNGIYLYSSGKNSITGNNCNNNSAIGIFLSTSSNNNVTGNISTNNTISIRLDSSDNNTVTDNTCNNNNTGIQLSSSSNNTVTGNTCIRGTGQTSDYASGQYTIRLQGTTNNYNLITNNNCMGKPVVVEGGTGNTVFNNKWDESSDFEKHKAEKASESKLGHVKAKTKEDGTLIMPINILDDNSEYNAVLSIRDITKIVDTADYGGNIRAIAADDNYVYVGGLTPQTVKKFNKSDLSQVAESASYGGNIYAIATDDNYVYVGGATTRTVKKLNKSDLSPVAESASYGGDIQTIAVDDTYVYVGGATPRTVKKLNKSDLSQVAESASYGGDIQTIAVDDTYVYVGGATTRTVKKLNKSNLSQVAESASYGGDIQTIAVDDTYVYVGGATTQTVKKLNKSNLSQVAESASYGGNIQAIAVDDTYVYVGGATTQTVKKLGGIHIKELIKVV
jgi:parallel beta-helix repeat protein